MIYESCNLVYLLIKIKKEGKKERRKEKAYKHMKAAIQEMLLHPTDDLNTYPFPEKVHKIPHIGQIVKWYNFYGTTKHLSRYWNIILLTY